MKSHLALLLAAGWFFCGLLPFALAESGDALAAVDRAASVVASRPAPVELRYRFAKDETLRYRVVHLATIDTKIGDTHQTAKNRSASTKVWQVTEIDGEGNITFVHQVEDVDMWNRMSGQEGVRYNSTADSHAPLGYESIAGSVGRPLSVITMTPQGRILRREDKQTVWNYGRDLTPPLPEHPVQPGDTWSVPREISVRTPDGRVTRVKIRDHYRLRSVSAGVATIETKTQLLTPVREPEIRAQLVHWMYEGEIRFDIDAGRVLSQRLDKDETVLGFSGAASMMQLVCRVTEEVQQ